MKKYIRFKSLQLIFLAAAAVACFLLRQYNILLWGLFALSFIFLFLDFGIYGRYQEKINEAVEDTPPDESRQAASLDDRIATSLTGALPDDTAALSLKLTTDADRRSSASLADFYGILSGCAAGKCLLGVRGRDALLAVFDNGGASAIDSFLREVDAQIDIFNASHPSQPIRYRYGLAYHEGAEVSSLLQLIELAENRS
ncbi:MAG: hypothetical protein UHN88_03255 [Eubacterium sp.]|nr:hypothetical protein [Eubacterium sp.]